MGWGKLLEFEFIYISYCCCCCCILFVYGDDFGELGKGMVLYWWLILLFGGESNDEAVIGEGMAALLLLLLFRSYCDWSRKVECWNCILYILESSEKVVWKGKKGWFSKGKVYINIQSVWETPISIVLIIKWRILKSKKEGKGETWGTHRHCNLWYRSRAKRVGSIACVWAVINEIKGFS